MENGSYVSEAQAPSMALARIGDLDKTQILLGDEEFAMAVEGITDGYLFHIGYNETEIAEMKAAPEHTSLCEYQYYGWVCGDGRESYHSEKDSYNEYAEMISWVLNELGEWTKKRT
jgi:hypothetical protein